MADTQGDLYFESIVSSTHSVKGSFVHQDYPAMKVSQSVLLNQPDEILLLILSHELLADDDGHLETFNEWYDKPSFAILHTCRKLASLAIDILSNRVVWIEFAVDAGEDFPRMIDLKANLKASVKLFQVNRANGSHVAWGHRSFRLFSSQFRPRTTITFDLRSRELPDTLEPANHQQNGESFLFIYKRRGYQLFVTQLQRFAREFSLIRIDIAVSNSLLIERLVKPMHECHGFLDSSTRLSGAAATNTQKVLQDPNIVRLQRTLVHLI